MYTNWQQFGTNKSNASGECPNTWVPMFYVQTVKNRDLSAPQPDLSVCIDRKIVILYVYLHNLQRNHDFTERLRR